MRKTFLIASGLVFAGLVGCQAPQQTPEDLNQRTTAAMSMDVGPDRDDKLMRIAGDAANARNANACLTAVDDINDHTRKDNTAHACADTFNNNGDRDTALMLVNKISDKNLQNQILGAYSNKPAPAPTTAPMPMMPH